MRTVPSDAAPGVNTAKRQARRAHRYRQLAMLHRFSRHELDAEADGQWDRLAWRRTAGCGRSVVTDDGLVAIRATATDDGTVAYTDGVMRCGSVWLCPSCSATIKTHRQMELNAAALAHSANGGLIAMATMTVRHDQADTLATLQDALSGSWKSLQQSAVWRILRSHMVGTITAKEVTWGTNGWHPHLHVLLLLEPGCEYLVDILRDWGRDQGAWAERVERRLGKRPNHHGFHVRRIESDAASYVAKIAAETTRGDFKTTDAFARILTGLEQGETWAVHRWREWVATMPGRRMLVWSRGLRAELLPDVEDLDDDQVVMLDRGGAEVGTLDRPTYRRLIRAEHGAIPGIVHWLGLVEATGTAPGLGPPRGGLHGPAVPSVEREHRVTAARRR